MKSSVNLGPRLKLVASYIPQGALLGDIGTDHAYLPIYLWEEGRITKAVAVDVHKGPYESACSAIQARDLSRVIDVRLGDGLRPLRVGEVDTLALAGMGGNTMLEIFAPRPDIMAQVQDLILQPQGAEGKVRYTLTKEGWRLREEQLVTEEGRIYVVMHYNREEGFTFDQLQNKAEDWYRKVLSSIRHLMTNATEAATDDDGIATSNTTSKISASAHTSNETDDIKCAADESCELKPLVISWYWDLGPLNLENPTPELLALIEEQQSALRRTLEQMQKATQPQILPKIEEFRRSIQVLEGMKKCLFPSA